MKEPLAILQVNNFACIKHAELVSSDLTVIIGPQASGKSILSKLHFFFLELFREIFSVPDEPIEFSGIAKNVNTKFKAWFPPHAWGKKKFDIRFIYGSAEFIILRNSFTKKPSENVKFTASRIFMMRLLISERLSRGVHFSKNSGRSGRTIQDYGTTLGS